MTRLENERWKTWQLLAEILKPGEHVLWYGYCESKLGQQEKARGYVGDVLIGLFACVFVTLFTGGLLSDALGSSFGFAIIVPIALLFMIMFLKGGGGEMFARDSQIYCRQHTVYALTDQRVLVFRNCNSGVPVRSVPLRFIDRVRVTGVRTYDRGTVEFLSWNPFTGTWTIPLRFF
ncbi:MAG TPA: hypothetical protein VFP05_10030, partial [Thermomicrobiales bacterium]|nr:hypothetical protein [Thermomicrobiales bacterium]